MLYKLIEIQNIRENDPTQKLFIELSILEEKSVNDIKSLPIETIDRLINKYSYLYSNKPIDAIHSFKIDGQEYKLPLSLLNLPYGIWEDLEFINNNIRIGNEDIEEYWEKFPFILYILTYGKNYVKENASDNIIEGSKVFKNISIKDALAVSNFFLLLKGKSLIPIKLYFQKKVINLLKTLI